MFGIEKLFLRKDLGICIKKIMEVAIFSKEKLKNSSRIRRFTRREAIQILPKFALANLRVASILLFNLKSGD